MMNPPHRSGDDASLRMLEDSVAAYVQRALAPRRLRSLHANSQNFDRSAWREMAELGWTALLLPEARGGLALGNAAMACVARDLGRAVAGEPFIESAVVAVTLLNALAGDDDVLQQLVAGEVVVTQPMRLEQWCVAPTVSAGRAGDGYILEGSIEQLPLATDAGMMIVPASLGGQLAVFLLAPDSAGITVQACQLADGTRDARIRFKNASVDATSRLEHTLDAVPAIEYAIASGGLAASAYLLGLAEALFEITLDYVRSRRQFGRAIGSFQALQHRLVDVFLQIRMTRASLDAAILAGDRDDGFLRATLRARHRACETALYVAREAIQMHGAIGYTEQCDVSLYVQRALVMVARYGGAREELAARGDFLGVDANAAAHAKESAGASVATPPEGDWNALDDGVFRSTVRNWIEENYPPELRHYPGQVRWADIKAWHRRLLERGWAAPAWPSEHGGMRLAAGKMLIFIEELERHGVTRAPDQGIVMIGPILLEYGTAEQRARFLQPALNGDHIWCQGYSEPNAGSDLATLATRAVRDGDEFVVNGQKTWTSHALDATHMYCLVRTDTAVKPQAGISFLLIDLDQPGVTVRPITNLGGDDDFCEVFLDNVRVPVENLVGELNQGWTIAKALLGHERLFVGSPKLCQHALNQLRELAHAKHLIEDPVFSDALLAMTLDVLDLEALYAEFATIVKAGGTPGADVALLKIGATETYVRLSELIFKYAGPAAATRGATDFGGSRIDVLSHYYSARPAPIYAGRNEIQRDIIARHVLGLPK